jgi:hypothetical protein
MTDYRVTLAAKKISLMLACAVVYALLLYLLIQWLGVTAGVLIVGADLASTRATSALVGGRMTNYGAAVRAVFAAEPHDDECARRMWPGPFVCVCWKAREARIIAKLARMMADKGRADD